MCICFSWLNSISSITGKIGSYGYVKYCTSFQKSSRDAILEDQELEFEALEEEEESGLERKENAAEKGELGLIVH